MAPRLVGWRYAALITGLVGMIGLAIYPIIIDPMMDPSKYKRMQERSRTGIRQEDIQPGNMKVWTDPFDRNKST
ncbi:small integral membrane protein 20 [Diabrotica virgifera virgifera]|uniref:Small integral membrane protein 20 n=1 Tax=Diabrotica virgifera virgifera TaxID=50390 RepID=A0A6P7F870_DIAVI|nr:small integral membrane protein 20 [Diabrotica virgifera virgifera]